MKKKLQPWRLIRDKDYDGFSNMAIDEAISIACGEEKSPTTLRFYGWKSPTVSIGYSQKKESDINIQYCNSRGIDIVKRPTGGRAVLHENELTFSVNASLQNLFFPKNILKSHKKISEALLLGINRLGINAELQYKSRKRQVAACLRACLSEDARSQATHRQATKWSYRSSEQTENSSEKEKPLRCNSIKQISRHPVCFSATSIYELVADEKKIIGCAQRRFKNSFLEHGSIPLKLDRTRLAAIFKNSLPLSGNKLESLHFKNMAGLNELGSQCFSTDQIAENIIAGFEQRFGISFKEENLSDYEKGLIRKIERRVAGPQPNGLPARCPTKIVLK